MSEAGTSGGGGDDGHEVADLVRQLRAELATIAEQGVRRQERLQAFDEQLRQMEGSLHAEVDRLRSTGSAVDLLTDELCQIFQEVRAERDDLSESLVEVRSG